MNGICVITSQNANSKSKRKIYGVIHLEKKGTKVHIHGEVKGLKKGKHGFHIHESGNLTEGCKSLCSHFNPHNKNHGGPNDKERHVGDLGNIVADSKGIAKFSMYDNLVKLSGKYSVIGRSMIIHEDEDDLGKGGNEESLKTGNAGKRIACGIIGIKTCSK